MFKLCDSYAICNKIVRVTCAKCGYQSCIRHQRHWHRL